MKSLTTSILIVLFMVSPAQAQTWLVEKATKTVMIRGYTRSAKTAVISSEASGKLLKLNVDVGDLLGKEPLAQIDPTFLDFEIRGTRVALARLKTRIKMIDSRIVFLTKEHGRKETLYTKGRATEVMRDAAVQELDQAILELEAATRETGSLDVTLEQLLEKRSRYFVKGPEGWVVTEKTVEAGEVIQAGQPLAVVRDFRQLVVLLAVSNDELAGIQQKGERFKSILEGRPVMASLDYINPGFDETTRKIPIRLLIHDYDELHRGGLRFEFHVTKPSRGLKIPKAAVLNRYDNPKVFKADNSGPVRITVLDSSDGHLIIADNPELPIGTSLTLPPGKQP